MLTDRQFFALAVLVYGVATVLAAFLWRSGFREETRRHYLLLLSGMVLHTVAMAKRGFSLERCPVNNMYEATTFVAWTIVVAYLVIGAWPRMRFLGAFASPVLFLMGVFALMPALDVKGPRPDFSGSLVSLHAALILLAYGAFGLSFVVGLMYLTQEHDLKFHKMRAVISRFPPIQRLEHVMGRLLLVGLLLLTGGLALAPFLLKQSHGVYFVSDPKVIWSLVVWALYGGLLWAHRGLAPGGRRFAWGAVGGFAFVLLTFWGFNLLSGIHNP